MASIKDVAKEAHVAISTVSKVLNNYPNISQETKDKVNAAIVKLNFVPNAVASALSSKKPSRVAILMNQDTLSSIDEVDMHYLSGAIPKALELRMDAVTIFFSMLKDKDASEIITYLQSQSVEGLVVFGLSKDETEILKVVQSGKFKAVVIDAPLFDSSTSCVWVDQYKAQYDVANELFNMNNVKKVLYLAGKKNSFVCPLREKAIRDICKEKKLTLGIRHAEFSEKKAREIVLKEGDKYDCVVCASDLCAIGAMRALTDLDIFRPVCGFDGISLMGYAGKQMTTVKQDFVKIAATAMEELMRLFKGEEGREVVMEHEIVRIEYLDVIV